MVHGIHTLIGTADSPNLGYLHHPLVAGIAISISCSADGSLIICLSTLGFLPFDL